jgi:hypothetical protein
LLKELDSRPKPVKFTHVQVANYMHTADEKFWPADLKWILQATYVTTGAPRFVLVADNKVMANVAGRNSIASQLLPVVDRVAGSRGR